jgi:Bacterial SH3 domain
MEHNKIMKKLILLIGIVIISCNSQTKKVKNIEKQMKNANYEDTLYKEYAPLMKDFLKDSNFKFLTDEIFREKVINLFGVDVSKSKFDDVVPYKLNIPNLTSFIRKENFIDFYELDRGVVDGAGDALKSYLTKERSSDDLFILYNKLILNDDVSTLPYILKDPFHLEHIVLYYNYEKNNLLNDAFIKTIKSTKDYPDSDMIYFLWFNNKSKPEVIRKKLISQLLIKKPEFIFDLTYFLFENKNNKLPSSLEKYKDQTLAYLIEIQLQHYEDKDLSENKGYSLLNNFYIQRNDLKKVFENNSFYNYPNLKKYTETYLMLSDENSNPNSKTNKINDPDGFTNLRKEKSTTSAILEKLKTGESVEVIEQVGDWYLVKTKAGNTGYVFKTKIIEE